MKNEGMLILLKRRTVEHQDPMQVRFDGYMEGRALTAAELAYAKLRTRMQELLDMPARIKETDINELLKMSVTLDPFEVRTDVILGNRVE